MKQNLIRTLGYGLLVLAVLAVVAPALAFPKPSPVPYRWELEFVPGPLRLYVDELDGRAYWYFTYMVINRTGRDRVWAPELTLFTDRGEIMKSGRDVPSDVTDRMMGLMDNELLESQNQIIGDLLQGEENAREGLAIWPARQLETNEISLFVRGISGESVRVAHPISGDQVTVYKTLQRDYLVPGDATARGSRPAMLAGQTWVMR
jgi:hypothetical protein